MAGRARRARTAYAWSGSCFRSFNRSGFGALVEIRTTAGTQRREIGAQSSYLSQNALEAHFGLGSAKSVEQLRVLFPSGVERSVENIPVNQTIVIDE